MKKKVLFISAVKKVSWGGSEELWSRTAEILARNNEVEVLALVKKWVPRHERINKLQQNGVRILEYADKSRLERVLEYTGRNSISVKLKAAKPDLVILSQGSYFDGTDWLRHLSMFGIPYCIITQAAADTWWQPDHEADILRKAYENAEQTFFVSEDNRQIVERQLGIALKNAEVVLNSFNVDPEVNIHYPSTTEGYKLACVARLTPNAKAQDLIIEVMAKSKWRTRNLEVYLYGRGENERGLQRLIDFHELSNVHIAGHADVETIWAQCHGLLLPSRHEGLPLSAIEAMMCRRIVIGSKVAVAELVTDGEDGYCLDYTSVEALDMVLEKAWQNKEHWQQMGERAEKTIKLKLRVLPEFKLVERIKKMLHFD